MLDRLPLVGRAEQLARLRDHLERAVSGTGGLTAIVGAGGVGKSRLAHTFLHDAARRGCRVVSGRAYAAEQGVPYSAVADAFTPLLRALPPETLRSVARGTEAELAQLFPGGPPDVLRPGARVESAAQLLWGFTEFARCLATLSPLVVLIDDLQWADAASRELLHFLVRNCADVPLSVVVTVNDGEEDAQSLLATLGQSLGRLGLLDVLRLGPLSEPETCELVCAAFRTDDTVAGDFARALYRLTSGNPFFIDEILKGLVHRGALVEVAGTWRGWDALPMDPPRTVRDAVRLRCESLSPAAHRVAEIAAVFGAKVEAKPLRVVAEMPDGDLADALDELCRVSILQTSDDSNPVYDFRHPLVRTVLYDDIGVARRRLLHGRIAEVLEARHGDAAVAHADDVARHFLKAGMEQEPRTGRYLRAAGQAALRRHADRAAADYLAAALHTLGGDDDERIRTLEDLARARLRLGELSAALGLLEEARTHAAQARDDATAARLWWRTGLAQYWAGDHEDALRSLEAGSTAAAAAAHPALLSRIEIARGTTMHALGRVAEAEALLRSAHAHADAAGLPALQARAQRALLLFHIWTGPPALALAHGQHALELARASGDAYLEATVHWALAVLHGLTGRAAEFLREIQECRRLADVLGSPFLRVAALELHVEYCYGAGDWDTGLAMGERAIAIARSLQLRALLPRALVWTAFIYLGRDEVAIARAYIEEAARAANADDPAIAHDIHSAVPVAIGRAAYHIALGDWERAVVEGERGLALIERTGFHAWAVHRLLPLIAEALLFQHDVERCRPYGERLRREAEALEHGLGLAWADTYDAVAVWLGGDPVRGASLLRAAADRLEAVPYVYDAARVRRQLAGRLFDIDDRDGALRALRRAHDVFARLGARRELEKAREQFREMDARPQPRTAVAGSGMLTDRETEIAEMVAAGHSNKAIARRLGISPRTVGTHVSNIFRKLELSERHQLEEWTKVNR